MNNLPNIFKTSILPASITCALFVQYGYAQESAGSPQLEEIVVTGSRIVRQDLVSASPIATVDSEALLAAGQVNVEEALNQMPQFSLGQGAVTNGFGDGGRATVNLRGLGDKRNLVLLDGRRLPASSSEAVVDINLIPQIILENVEVISGGASAVYGSDAISGVVNFKTRQGFEGTQVDVQYGVSSRGDADNTDASFLMGKTFDDGRGSIMAAINYTDRSELIGEDRGYYRGRGSTGFFSTGRTLNVLTGNPDQATVDGIFGQYGVAPGAVPASSQVGFNNDGTLFAVTGGANLRDPNGRLFVDPGNGSVSEAIFNDRSIISPQERYTLYSKADFEITPELTAYATGLYMDSTVVTSIGYPLNVPDLNTVPVTNPFISPDFAAWLEGRPNAQAPVLLFKRFFDTGRRVFDTNYETYQVVAGLKGELGEGNYTWDIYYSRGETDITEDHPNSVLSSRVQELLDAPDGGASICEGGYNPFGWSGNSQDCLDYISVSATNHYGTEQDVLEASIQGKLFSLPVDDVRFALTATYREDGYFRKTDPLFASGDIVSNPELISQPFNSIEVSELAGELLIPLTTNANMGLGYRYSDYSHVGQVDTYKADFDFRPIDTLMLRGGFERAVRAPNFNEAFAPISGSVASIGPVPAAGDPCDVGSAERMDPSIADELRNLCLAQGVPADIYPSYSLGNVSAGGTFTGNSSLEPEEADTFTAGFVFTPDFGDGIVQNPSISVDYYSIEIEKAINLTGSGADILNACFNRSGGNPTLDPANENCQLISRDPSSGIISNIRTTYINSGGFKTSGVDIILNGELHFDALPGYFRLGSAMNFLDKFEVASSDTSPFIDYKNTVEGTEFPALAPLPEFKALTTFDYVADNYTVGVRWRHVGSMENRTTITNPGAGDPGPDDYNVIDLVGNIQLTDTIRIGAGITNLLDEDPFILLPGNYVAGGHDQIGRAYYLRVSANF